jgi:hypothetical protein
MARTLGLGWLALLALWGSSAPTTAQDYFRVTSLGSLQAQAVPATFRDYRLNSLGQVVGNANGTPVAGVWQNGTVTSLGTWGGGTYSRGVAINNSGVVAAQLNDSFGQNFAAVRSGGSWNSLLYPSGYQFTSPTAINAAGRVVGYATVSPTAGLPFGQAFYHPGADGNTRPILLPHRTQDTSSIALGINDNNFIVGNSFASPASPTAVLWNTSGGMLVIGAANQSSAQAINNNNIAVGYTGSAAVAYIFNANTSQFETFGLQVSGVANAINSNNFIVGNTVQTNTPSQSLAWLYDPTDGSAYSLTALQSSGRTLYTASDINANMQIVGQSSLGGYIATPVARRLASGSWGDSSGWLWGLTPNAVHPVTLTNGGTTPLVVTGAPTATISELTLGGGGGGTVRLEVGAGQTLTVAGNTWGNGRTSVEATGTLVVNGQFNSPVTVRGALTGSGVVNGTVTLLTGGVVSPGQSPGVLSTGTLIAGGGSQLDWELKSWGASPTAGADFDQLVGLSGSQLDLSGVSATNRLTIRILSLTPTNQAGLVSDFDPNLARSWTVARYSQIVGFSEDKFILDTTGFANAAGSTSFSISTVGGDLILTFSPVPEPTSVLAVAAVGLFVWTARRVRR